MAEKADEQGGPVSLEALEKLCREYGTARAGLSEIAELIQEEQRAVIRQRGASLKARLKTLRLSYETLRAAIVASPDLFGSKKTLTLADVKIGWRKQPGRLDYADEAKVIAAIRRKMPAHEPLLIKTTEKLAAAGLKNLDAKELASIGVSIRQVGDKLVIGSAEGDLDKIVSAMIDEVGKETEAEQEARA